MVARSLSAALELVLTGRNESVLPTRFVEFLPSSFLLPSEYGIMISDSPVWLAALDNDQMWSPPFGSVYLIEDIPGDALPVLLRFLQDHAPYLAAIWVKSTTDPASAAEYLGDPTEWMKETSLYTALQRAYALYLTR